MVGTVIWTTVLLVFTIFGNEKPHGRDGNRTLRYGYVEFGRRQDVAVKVGCQIWEDDEHVSQSCILAALNATEKRTISGNGIRQAFQCVGRRCLSSSWLYLFSSGSTNVSAILSAHDGATQ